MGCSCMKRQELQNEQKNEMSIEEGINKEEVEEKDPNFNNLRQEAVNTECISLDQDRSEEIFDFFNELRNFPQKYIEESKKYDLENIILSAEIRQKSGNINMLIKNPFFKLFLDTFVQKYPYSKENIIESLNNDKNIENYKKNFYCSKAPIENPKECIWNLLKENKDIALDEILYKKMDYFIVSTISFLEKKTILAYFLFLKKN